MTSRMSVSSAACAVSCRGIASSSSREPVIAKGSTSRSGSARAKGAFGVLVRGVLVAELTMGEPGQQMSLDDR